MFKMKKSSIGRPKKDWAPQHNGGPKIKSGPTYDQPRSKNNNGRWRKKRSDAGKPRKDDNFMTQSINKSRSPRDTHGPTVKTGPNAGKNRTRGKDGHWRRKRSDAGTPRKKHAA
jgi:hypothetical protein